MNALDCEVGWYKKAILMRKPQGYENRNVAQPSVVCQRNQDGLQIQQQVHSGGGEIWLYAVILALALGFVICQIARYQLSETAERKRFGRQNQEARKILTLTAFLVNVGIIHSKPNGGCAMRVQTSWASQFWSPSGLCQQGY